MLLLLLRSKLSYSFARSFLCSNLHFRFVNIGFFWTFFFRVCARSLTEPFSRPFQAGPICRLFFWDMSYVVFFFGICRVTFCCQLSKYCFTYSSWIPIQLWFLFLFFWFIRTKLIQKVDRDDWHGAQLCYSCSYTTQLAQNLCKWRHVCNSTSGCHDCSTNPLPWLVRQNAHMSTAYLPESPAVTCTLNSQSYNDWIGQSGGKSTHVIESNSFCVFTRLIYLLLLLETTV